MTLAQIQAGFRAWLVDDDIHAVPHVSPHAFAGLAVYQNNYRAQLIGCLESSFPQVRQWLGEEAFLEAAVTHVHRHPPHAWTLDVYADDFGKTLEALYPDNPDLHELAWIEHAVSDAFVAADAEPLPPEALGNVDWSTAQIRLTPSLRSRAATTNAEAVWSALCADHTPPESEMLAQARGLLVWRRDYRSWLKEIDALEHAALLRLQRDGSFESLCEWLVLQLGEEEGVERAGILLAGWLNAGLIVGTEAEMEIGVEPHGCASTTVTAAENT
jgi:hypothetical protein